MKKHLYFNSKLSSTKLALVSALALISSGNLYAACSTSSGNTVNCTGTLGGTSNGALMVTPSDYSSYFTNPDANLSGKPIVGYDLHNDTFSFTNIGSMSQSLPRFSILNIGSGTTSPTIGTAPDSSTSLITGLKSAPGGYLDIYRASSNLLNYEGVDIGYTGTVNSFGSITNTSDGTNWLVTNGPKVYTEGGADNLPYRTLGVFLNGESTTLNNYGKITIKANNTSLSANLSPNLGADIYLKSGLGSAPLITDMDGKAVAAGMIFQDSSGLKYIVDTGGKLDFTGNFTAAKTTLLTDPTTSVSLGSDAYSAKIKLLQTKLNTNAGSTQISASQNQVLKTGEMVVLNNGTADSELYTVTTAGSLTGATNLTSTNGVLTLASGGVLTPTKEAMYSGNANTVTNYAYSALFPTSRAWESKSYVSSGFVTRGDDLYFIKAAGILGSTAPTHPTNVGDVLGNGKAVLTYLGSSTPWTNGTAVAVGNYVKDSKGNIYQVTGAGTLDAEAITAATTTTSINSGTATLSYVVNSVPGISKPTLYGVLGTSDSEDFYSNVRINNYNTITMANESSGGKTLAAGNAIQIKENILDARIYNAPNAIIEATATVNSATTGAGSSARVTATTHNNDLQKQEIVVDNVNTSTTGTAYTQRGVNGFANVGGDPRATQYTMAADTVNLTGIQSKSYTTTSSTNGPPTAIGSDNNSDYIELTNNGIIRTLVNYPTSDSTYGRAMSFGNQRTLLTNNFTGRILGDIAVGSSANEFTFYNAGILTGNVVITPNAGNGVSPSDGGGPTGSLKPILQTDGSYKDIATPRSEENKIVIQPVINASGGNIFSAIDNSKVGVMSGTVYVNAGGAYENGHPFKLYINPIVASGVTVKTGDTYQFAGSNISVAVGALATANSATCSDTVTIGCITKQIDADNITTNLASGDSNTGLVSWAFDTGKTNTVVATVRSASSISGLTSSASNALSALLNFDSTLGSQIQNISDETTLKKVAEQIRPEANGASQKAAIVVTDKVFGLVESRLNEIHLAGISRRTGIATGNQPEGVGFWAQGFGGRGEQDKRGSVDGYKSNALGMALGVDQLLGKGLRLGLAGSYGQSSFNNNGDNPTIRNNVDTYQGTLYASKLMNSWYFNTTLGLGYHDYSNSRTVLTNYIKGSHDAWQYSAKVDAGYPIQLKGITLAPVASLGYSRLNENSYTETGVGALAINSHDTDSLRSGLGAKAMLPILEGDVNAGIELRAVWNHEFMNTAQDSTARFVGGGSAFTTSGVTPKRDGADLGASFRLAGVMDGIQHTLLLNYDAEVKPQYINQTGSLQARFDF